MSPSPTLHLSSPSQGAVAPPPHRFDVEIEIERACARIAPTWPLDRFIAVNPLWEQIDRPLPEVAADLAALSGARMLMPRSWFREQWRTGALRTWHLRAAIAQTGAALDEAELQSLLDQDTTPPAYRPRVMDIVDRGRDLVREMSWREFIVSSISQSCAAHFDDAQASLPAHADGGLYASWRRRAIHDRGPALLMGLDAEAALVRALPSTADAMISVALTELDVPAGERERYLTGLLLDVNGWAAWCAYRRWTARLGGGDDRQIRELLAVRLAWEWMLLRAGGPELASRWRTAMSAWPKIDADAHRSMTHDWLLQRAIEIAWQEPTIEALTARLAVTPTPPPAAAQAVFCIDVRSEVFRRALEAADPTVQTLGFAGFFGMPIEYQPLGSPDARPQLPGLLAPRLRVTDSNVDGDAASKRIERIEVHDAWRSFKRGAVSGFSFVESVGLLFAGKLFGDAFGRVRRRGPDAAGLSARANRTRKPRLPAFGAGAVGVDERCDLAAGMLRAMSLTRDLARLVMLVGHGSETRNNPHAAGLDCGACCGQTGEVNARAAAALLNEPEVRAGLAARGIDAPDATRFVAGLHNTTTDEVELFDLDELPASHHQEVETLRSSLADAGVRARRERAAALGLAALDDAELSRAVRSRARDWAQVRPEWGLANNAAFIVAPRERTAGLDLAGRAFLHEYRHELDEGYGILELIMTAPMVVTHWINLQYYASTVDNLRYGSGNKVLHDVVGGHIGVFEGNGGDLRIGLPLQSLHDGERWVHTPLRLSVFIEAPRAAIEGVLSKHDKVRQLVDNEWLYLLRIDSTERCIQAYRQGEWVDTCPV